VSRQRSPNEPSLIDVVRAELGSGPNDAVPDVTLRPHAKTDLVAQAVLVAVGLIYPAWHWVFLALMTAPRDPLGERLVVGGLCLAAVVLHRLRVIGPARILVIEQGALFAFSGHYLSIVYRNDFARPYTTALFIVVASVSALIEGVALAMIYSILSLATVALMLWRADLQEHLALEWLVGMTATLLAGCIGAFRTSVLRRRVSHRLSRERELLKHVIETIPDPVFVRNTDRDLVMANQAARQFEGATGFDLETITRQELTTLESGIPVEADTEVTTRFGHLAVSVKTARTESSDLQPMVVTVMRDVTDRRTLEDSLRSKIRELEQARERVRQLQGILPICMHCSRIRSETNQWDTLERFVKVHSDAKFTHTLCNECIAEHYPEEVAR
jgi:PAS domain-containing protein